MPRWIDITFREPADIHRVRNFAEELSLVLDREHLGSLPMDEADRAVGHVRITAVRARVLNRLLARVKEILVAHGFSGEAMLTHGTEADD